MWVQGGEDNSGLKWTEVFGSLTCYFNPLSVKAPQHSSVCVFVNSNLWLYINLDILGYVESTRE